MMMDWYVRYLEIARTINCGLGAIIKHNIASGADNATIKHPKK